WRARLSVVDSEPSIKISGETWYPKVVTPRTRNCALTAPGSPESENAIRPGIRPANADVKLEDGPWKSRALTVVIAPTTLDFFCVPKATIVTSSIVDTSSES